MIEGADRRLFVETLTQAVEAADGEPLDAVLTQFGWLDALGDDRRTAISVLFDLQGRTGTTSTALGAAMADALGLMVPAGATFVLPALGPAGPPGRLDAGALEVRGLAQIGATAPNQSLVATDDASMVVVAVSADQLQFDPVGGLDPALGLQLVSGPVAAVTPVSVSNGATWSDALIVGRLALAHALIGGARTMLELARDHAVERVQFGRPIAQFQAVRHRLAEAHVAVEAAAAAVDAGWEEGSPLAAAAAKAIAGRSARQVARHAQQVLAGIGFTTEHPLHTYVRRTLTLDALLGDARTITRSMGEDLLAGRQLPPLPLL